MGSVAPVVDLYCFPRGAHIKGLAPDILLGALEVGVNR